MKKRIGLGGVLTTLLMISMMLEMIQCTLNTKQQRWLKVNNQLLFNKQSLRDNEYPIVESASFLHKTLLLTPFDAVSQTPFNKETFGTLFTLYKDSLTPSPVPGTSSTKRSRRNIVPTYVGTMTADEVRVEWTAPCFQQNVGWLKYNSQAQTVTITFHSQNASSYLCSDWYLFATQESMHIKAAFMHGTHSLTITNLLPSDIDFILNKGVFGFVFEDGLLGTVIDAYFAGRALYDTWFQKDKINFLHNNMPDFNFDKRPFAYTPVMDTSQIGNGDLLGVVTLSGLDVILMYGTGSHIGHVATTLWLPVDGKKELYVVEAYDVGIIKTPYDRWIADHAADGRIVILGKLRDEFANKMNVTKAIEFFSKNEGLPYGYQNIAFAWIDSIAGNYPSPLDTTLVPSALTIFDKLSNKYLNIAFLEGLNQRFKNVLNLEQSCSNMECVVKVADSLNMTVQELLTIPEQDSWRYNGNRAMVCSVFIMSIFKESGVLAGYELQATEFTPKDLYMLDIWNKSWDRPEICHKNGDKYPYCQMLGEWFWPLPDYAGYSTVPLYSHMNEQCESKPPTYIRGPSNC